MAWFRCVLVPSALVCVAMFLQGCALADQAKHMMGELQNAALTAETCATQLGLLVADETESSLVRLADLCTNHSAAFTDPADNTSISPPCADQGAELITDATKAFTANASAACMLAVSDMENALNRENKNATLIPGEVHEWINATEVQHETDLLGALNIAIMLAQNPHQDMAAAKQQIANYFHWTPALVGEFSMSGGNKIQAMSTSHAGRWVAAACGMVMLMAGVFRFSRRAWLTPSSTDIEKLVNGEDIEGSCVHIAE